MRAGRDVRVKREVLRGVPEPYIPGGPQALGAVVQALVRAVVHVHAGGVSACREVGGGVGALPTAAAAGVGGAGGRQRVDATGGAAGGAVLAVVERVLHGWMRCARHEGELVHVRVLVLALDASLHLVVTEETKPEAASPQTRC